MDQHGRYGADGARGRRPHPEGDHARRSHPARSAPAEVTLTYLVNGTVMRVDLDRPLPPGARRTLDIGWSFPFGPNRSRMGIEDIDGGTTYEVAQWYPRLAVYDDVRGWNTEQYYGQAEFYLEYGSFDVSLTVPADMLVAATGTLRNPQTVLTATQRQRLAEARASDTTVIIRGVDEVTDPASRPPSGVRNPHLALHRRQRARLRLGRLAHLPVGRGRGEQGADARHELLSAFGRLPCGRTRPGTPSRRWSTTPASGRPIPIRSRATSAASRAGWSTR